MIPAALVTFAILALGGALAVTGLVRSRNMQVWIGTWVRWSWKRRSSRRPPRRHVYFCFADHYEPYGLGADRERAHARVARWVNEYPALAERHRDSFGNRPRHSYFYPAEEYDPELLDALAGLRDRGLGDVEVHLHHDNDTPENFRRTITGFARTLHDRHGFLVEEPGTGRLLYTFIHGNWALDNSRPDGRWCGIDNELAILAETGCVADMTMPSAPSDTQTSTINSIYFALGRAGCRKSHDKGRPVRVGDWSRPGELLMIQGPLTLNWKEGKWGVLPRIESGELSFDAPPSPHRIRLWGECAISIEGAEEHVFIKVHTHGATEKSMRMLFDQGGFDSLWTELERQYRVDADHTLRYVTAREMVDTIRALAHGAG
ncbi:MAG: hypothetical protein IPL06_14610 [Betaproteobacteria bacterium]|nr:hypothetical protein [Betaproteobacteria bacterium]